MACAACRGRSRKKVRPRIRPALSAEIAEAAEVAEVIDVSDVPQPWRQRMKRRVGTWIVRRLQKRVEREWREYEHTPKASLGPWRRRRTEEGGTQVYRSLVQIHFHPRDRAPRQ